MPLAFARRTSVSIHDRGSDGSVSQGEEFLQLSGEQISDIANSVQKMRERWDNKLVFPISKLGERYLGGDLAIVFDCSLKRPNIFSGDRFSLCVSRYDPDKVCGELGEFNARAGRNDDQLPVLIKSVHVMDDAERVIDSGSPALVRLEFFDQGPNSDVRNSMYFSLVSSQIVFRHRLGENRKLQRVLVQGLAGVVGENPDNVIERRTQVMDNFSSQNTKPLGDRQVPVIVNHLLPLLVVGIGDNWVLAGLKECEDFVMKIDDVLIGPL